MDLDKLNVRDHIDQAAEKYGDHPFLIFDDQVYSYRDLKTETDRAARLWHDLGVRKGDRVAFMLANNPRFLFGWLGLAKIGAILVGINIAFKATEVGYMVRHSGASFALVDGERADVMREVQRESPTLGEVISIDETEGLRRWDDLIEGVPAEAPSVELVGDDVISFIYTSGTTGAPKAVMQTHRNYTLSGQSYPSWVHMTSEDRAYMCMPLFHVNAQAYQTMGALGCGATIVMVPRFSASRFWDDIHRHKVTVWNFVGAMMVIISKMPPRPDDADNTLRIAYSGGGVSALSGETRKAIQDRYGIKLLGGFGMSETSFGCADPYDSPIRPGSIGLPRQHPDPAVPRNEARIVDDEGNDVPRGEIGELIFRNVATMKGYYEDPVRTAETLRDGWLYTGDLARQDEEGYFYFVDRKKDIIRRRGENISSVEVERTLRAHPSVAEAAVVAVPSELMDEEVLAFVVPTPGSTIDPEELWAWTASQLADFKVPRYLQVIDEIPKNGTQKIEKAKLREIAKEPSTQRFERAGAVR